LGLLDVCDTEAALVPFVAWLVDDELLGGTAGEVVCVKVRPKGSWIGGPALGTELHIADRIGRAP
jgi:hypothetical protein